jgi:hypothetical protein
MKSAPMKSSRIGYDVGHVTRVRSNPWASSDPWASRNPMKSAPMKSSRIGYDVGHVTRVRPNPWGSRGCGLVIAI